MAPILLPIALPASTACCRPSRTTPCTSPYSTRCLDPATGELTYVNAGHNPPLYLPADTDRAIELEHTGMWLGVDENSKFEQRTITLQPGDLLLLYTDGVTDALNVAGEEYGLERVREVIYQQRSASPEAISEALIQSLAAFTAGSAPFDDITLVLIKRQ